MRRSCGPRACLRARRTRGRAGPRGGGGGGRRTLWASTQTPFGVQHEVARALGLPDSDVRVIGTAVGGGFGGKNGLYEPLVAAAARAVGRRSEERPVGKECRSRW